MVQFNNKKELIDEIKKTSELFIKEFAGVKEIEQNKIIDGVDRTPSQMIAYQLGWMNLIQTWESNEQKGIAQVMPKEGYKWNTMGGLYEEFYKDYSEYTINELIDTFNKSVDDIIKLVDSYTEDELFEQGKRKWSSSTPANWPIYKWITINTASPFKTFRSKIRKWNRLNN